MFSLLDLHFGLWSLYLHVLRTQRVLGFFIVITHKSTRSENRHNYNFFEIMGFIQLFGTT